MQRDCWRIPSWLVYASFLFSGIFPESLIEFIFVLNYVVRRNCKIPTCFIEKVGEIFENKISIIARRHKMKKYLSDTIGDSYLDWEGKKIFISADTGFGKTFFIVLVYLKCIAIRRGKLLILCNRRLLRYQYWFDLIKRYSEGEFLETYVEVSTYQQIAEKLFHARNKADVLRSYTSIILDEVHYFYSDSDFNCFGTYLLLNEIIQLCFKKTLIFMSATMEPIEPFIKEGIARARCNQQGRYIIPAPRSIRVEESYEELEEHSKCIDITHSQINNYDRFHCIYFNLMEELAEFVALADKKSILFIDDKSKAKDMKELILKYGELSEKDIVIINADNLNNGDNNGVIEQLAIAHRVEPQILITTSVLDNGVSIHDENVGNLLIMTDSRVSFMQMIGRVRSESCQECNLLFLKRESSEFKYRMLQLEKEVSIIEELSNQQDTNNIRNIQIAWGADEDRARSYMKFLLPVSEKDMDEFFIHPYSCTKNMVKGVNLVLNKYAARKTRDMYMMTSLFYSLAVDNPILVVFKQMEWIRKMPDELDYYTEVKDRTLAEVKSLLLTVQGCDNDKYTDMKKRLTDEYREFIKHNYEKNLRSDRSLSEKTLSVILDDLCLKKVVYDKGSKRYYSITDKEGENE